MDILNRERQIVDEKAGRLASGMVQMDFPLSIQRNVREES
tara:strand:- start:368 stop:487 length:120 start_codon:yes stop_codon:yes gene_type:complete